MEDFWREAMKWSSIIWWALLASFGGAAGYIHRSLEQGERPSAFRVVFEGSSAGFVGVLVALACSAMNLSPQWTGMAVGVFGWLGATASIRVLERLVHKKLGIIPDGDRDAE